MLYLKMMMNYQRRLNKRGQWILTALLMLGIFSLPVIGQTGTAEQEVVTVTSAWETEAIPVGQTRQLAVLFDIEEPYHINPPSETVTILDELMLIETSVDITGLPAGVRVGRDIWPPYKEMEVDFADIPVRVYEKRTIVRLPITIGAEVEPGEYSIMIKVTYQACDDQVCLFPVDLELPMTLRVVSASTEVAETNESLFAEAEAAGEMTPPLRFDFFGYGFEMATVFLIPLLLLAALGGFLLNLTPCVLPLIPIKIMGMSKTAGTRSRTLLLGGAMFSGVVAFWLVLGLIIALSTGFSATNQLFQYPAFTIGVGVIIAVMAVGMCGVFTTRLPQWVYRINPSQEKVHGSFGFGIMTAILSTPCTAPFMGAAIAWAATQNPLITLSVFAAIGIGMGMPYLVLAAFPKLVEKMPRTGPASELIKQVMGLLMGAAAAYFLGTGLSGLMVTPPDPPSKAYWWAVAILIGLAGLWLVWKTFKITASPGHRMIWTGLAAFFILSAIGLALYFTDQGPVKWTYYTPERLEAAIDSGDVVVLDFTAEWCLNCHALERAYLHREAVATRLNGPDVTPMKVDLTGNNPDGNQLLRDMDRRTIPFLVVLGKDGQTIFASDAYTDREVLAAIDEARSGMLSDPSDESETAVSDEENR